ncbi:ABC transporter ATP-binding protein [Bacillus sp. 2205SS5-2]|uniref:ABC transporter ATP-binding protein n=1 Tax=Bacillus sp. 2205SS5-2 TaxID=3109031 RepID=UPI003007171A
MSSYIQLDNVTKEYHQQKIIQGLSLSLQKGEILSLIGPSGTGKSTLLRCISGLDSFSDGSIVLDGKQINKQKPQKREIGMVFQQSLLFPHLTVLENAMYGLRLKVGKRNAKQQALIYLKKIGLADFSGYYPNELSGGQQQRVALARTLLVKPKLLLLDEPFSSLDPELRYSMRDWVHQLLKDENVTAMFVTHDLEEAMVMGDRVGVLHNGTLQQIGEPRELYERPNNPFVATFFSEKWVMNEDSYVDMMNLHLTTSREQILENDVYLGEVVIKGISIRQGQEIIHMEGLEGSNPRLSLPNTLSEKVETFKTLHLYTKKHFINYFKNEKEG